MTASSPGFACVDGGLVPDERQIGTEAALCQKATFGKETRHDPEKIHQCYRRGSLRGIEHCGSCADHPAAAVHRRKPELADQPRQDVAPSAATGVESDATVPWKPQHDLHGLERDDEPVDVRLAEHRQHAGHERGAEPESRGAAASRAWARCRAQSGNVSGGAAASAGGTSAAAGGAVGSKVDMSDGPGKRGKGKAKGHDKRDSSSSVARRPPARRSTVQEKPASAGFSFALGD